MAVRPYDVVFFPPLVILPAIARHDWLFLVIVYVKLHFYLRAYIVHYFQDVAVKILLEQDFHPERLNEFLQEVCPRFFWLIRI